MGVPRGGRYRELFNSDSRYYGGSDLGNGVPVEAMPEPRSGQPHSVAITLPPLAAVIMAPE